MMNSISLAPIATNKTKTVPQTKKIMPYLKINLLGLLMLFILLVRCDKRMDSKTINAREKIIGEWIYMKDDRLLSMNFRSDQSVVMIWIDETANGSRNIKENGKKERILYKIGDDTDPMSLNLLFYKNQNDSLPKKMNGIFRFLSDDKIQYYGSYDQEIPNDFSSVQSVVLERKK